MTETESMFDGVRAACRAVAERAQHVRIDEARLREYAGTLPLERARAPQLDPTHHYLGEGDGTVAFVVTLDAINFGSGYFPHLRKRPGMSGYFTVASSLAEHFRAHGPWSAGRLAELDAAECTRVFGQDPENAPVQELMTHFSRALNDLGRLLLDRFEGSFVRLVESAEHSAERLARTLTEMPYFDDVQTYRGMRVPFYKRAQLTVADLALAFGGEGWGRFTDLDRMTIFADNLVPHVLRVDGVLRYAPRLAERIDREAPIPAHSEAEIEIRACGVHAVELLVDELRARGQPVTAMGLDYLLWNRGQEPHYKRIKPRHRARTVYY